MFTDYCVGENEFSAPFKTYLADRQYALTPVRAYVEQLKAAGFANVEGIDITEDFKTTLLKELQYTEQNRVEFMKRFSEEKFIKLTQGWKNKLDYIAAGDQKWGLFMAVKPN